MEIHDEDIMVSVCCITYNHEKYIAQALESFLMQETDFNVEIVIGEDLSTDLTATIIEQYCEDYPGKIRLVRSKFNVGSIQNQIRTMRRCKGKYIAMCDGDDFWTDPLKLQKQVDFLENNPEYIICCNYTEVINDQGETTYLNPAPVSMEFSYDDLLMGRREETRICSLMIRNNRDVQEIGLKDWYFKTYGSDTLFKLHATSTGKNIYVLPEVMSCYRLHSGGIWSMIDPKLRKSRMLSDFNLMIRNFNYSDFQRKELLKIYMKDFFLFDIRYRKFNNAAQTIATLW